MYQMPLHQIRLAHIRSECHTSDNIESPAPIPATDIQYFIATKSKSTYLPDRKSIVMPPAKKAAGKGGKGKGKDDAGDAKETKVKGAQQINVRHILVRHLMF